jgi:hypothetical protein
MASAEEAILTRFAQGVRMSQECFEAEKQGGVGIDPNGKPSPPTTSSNRFVRWAR